MTDSVKGSVAERARVNPAPPSSHRKTGALATKTGNVIEMRNKTGPLVVPTGLGGADKKSDDFAGMTPVRTGYRLREAVPGPVEYGPTPVADRPVSTLSTVLRMGGAVLGFGAIGAGIAVASVAAAPAVLTLGMLIVLIGLIAMFACVIAQVKAEDAVAKTGLNTKTFTDFSEEVKFVPRYYQRPNNEEDMRTIYRAASLGKTPEEREVKTIGSGHSWSAAFETKGYLVSLDRINHMQVLDKDSGIVRIGAGAKLKDINVFLQKNGLAFSNLGGITEQSIAGAVSTGTHGTGGEHGIIATQVERFKLMTPNGEVKWLSKGEKEFDEALVSFGLFGTILEVELKTIKATNIREVVTKTTFEDAFNQKKIEKRLADNEHFQIVWMPHSWDSFLVKRNYTKRPAEEEFSGPMTDPPFFSRALENFALGLTKIEFLRPFLMDVAAATQPSVDVNVGQSDRIHSRPLPPTQRELEFAFPLADAEMAMREVRKEIEKEGLLMNFPCSMRFVKGDDFLMSPANRGDSAYISVLLQGSTEQDDRVMKVIQRVMLRIGGRPHWGKQNDEVTPADLKRLYGPKYDRMIELIKQNDPTGIHANEFARRLFPEAYATPK